MASNLVFTWQACVGLQHWALAASPSSMENFTGAIGTVIFVAYLSALCQSPLHTATQYALLTALAAVGRTYLSSGAGYHRRGDRLGLVLRDQRAGRPAEPAAALVAAARAGISTRLGSAIEARRRAADAERLRRSALRKHLPAVPAVPFERLAVAVGPCSRHGAGGNDQPVHFHSLIVPQSPAPRALVRGAQRPRLARRKPGDGDAVAGHGCGRRASPRPRSSWALRRPRQSEPRTGCCRRCRRSASTTLRRSAGRALSHSRADDLGLCRRDRALRLLETRLDDRARQHGLSATAALGGQA